MAIILPAGQHYGETLHSIDSGMVTVSRILYKGDTGSETHGNERASMLFVEEGLCLKQMGKRTLELPRSAGLFLPPGWLQKDWFPSKTTFLSAEFSGPFLTRLREAGSSYDEAIVIGVKNSQQLRSQLMHELLDPDSFSSLVVEGMLMSTIALTSRDGSLGRKTTSRRGRVPAWLLQATELLHDLNGRQIKLDEIATSVGVHPAHLSREFRRHHGCTPGEYVRRLKVNRAKAQLSGTQTSLADIALQMGFSDQPHFSRIFKRYTGTAPLAYRRNYSADR
jgi:AraC family transcriptional regulator